MKKSLLILSTLTLLLLAGCQQGPKKSYASIAQCLTEKGVKFYGAFWCPHCSEQKEIFGDDMQYITYVECDAKGENANPAACRAAGVVRYPTWGFPGQENVTGVQTPEFLAQKANCPIDTSVSQETETTADETTAE